MNMRRQENMKRQPLWRISVATTPEAEDAVAELLASVSGAFRPRPILTWKPARAASAFSAKSNRLDTDIREEIAAGLKQIADCGLDIGAGKFDIAKVKREDWAESWKRHFKPIEIGDDAAGQTKLEQTASAQKSGGGHARSRLELRHRPASDHRVLPARNRALPRTPDTRQSFLDIGTGSGILAIAAAKLGYAPVDAFDFDPEAVRVAPANARKNRVAGQNPLSRGDVTQSAVRGRRGNTIWSARI